MLDGLDDIDWARLGHAYGGATDVPEQIRALRSPDAGARQKALHALYGNIFHQGTRYHATAYAVPFLLELLADPGTPDRAEIAGLCAAIAIGYDSSWLPGNVPIAEDRAAAIGAEAVLARMPAPEADDDDEYEYDLSEEDESKLYAHFAVTAYDAVRAGVPILLGLLDEPDAGLRTMAVYTLAWFAEEAGTILPRLRESTFDDPVVLATALVSTGLLGGRPDPVALQDSRPLVRWGAAVALGDAGELAAWVTGDTAGDARIPFLDGDLGGLASLALGRLGADAAFDALLARIPKVAGVAALPPVSEALRLAFPSPLSRGTESGALDARQHRLAEALAASPGTWLYNGMTFGNFSQLVGHYGLPRTAEAMRAFLGGGPA